MKRELKFTFRDDDDGQFYMVCNAENLYWVLWDYDNELRDIAKHSAEERGMDADTIDGCRSILHEFMADRGIDFNQVE